MAKRFRLIRIKNGLFTSTAVKESQLCLQQNKVIGIVYVLFTLIVFRHFVCLHHRHCPRITNLVLTQFFLARNQSRQSRAGGMGPSYRFRIVLPTSATSDIITRITTRVYQWARIYRAGRTCGLTSTKKKLMPCRLFGFACVLNV